ncbi:MAG: DUF4013 domain-containing protein [Anaerolineae bacterium]|jgi:predicted flap endonuclease-1-like 5' DNA nuclease|nr:DUF4013 domain-containing protein [Anaerolineae bacterium]
MGEKVKAFGKLPQILTFPFKGEGWFGKLGIAALIMLAGGIIPILPVIILLGYFYEMVHRIIVDQQDASLPSWDDWGGFLSNGFKWFLSTIIIALPFILVFIVMMGLNFIPLFFLENNAADDVLGIYFGLLFILQFVLVFTSMIFMVFMGVFAPVYMTHMVAEGELKAMFQIKHWWKIFKKGFWEFLISFLLMYGLGMILYVFYFFVIYSVVCCCLSPFVIGFGTVYLMAVYFALVASAYRDGREKIGEVQVHKPLNEGPAAVKPEGLPEPEPILAPEPVAEVEVVEEFDLPSPDGEIVEEAVELPEEATEIAVEVVDVVEEEAVPPVANVVETLVSIEVPEAPAEDATVIGDVNAGVAAAMGFAEATIKMDNLKKINGIGPKTADVLKQNGILTFGQLAETSVEHLKQILVDNGLEVVAASCEDWPQQAKDLL